MIAVVVESFEKAFCSVVGDMAARLWVGRRDGNS